MKTIIGAIFMIVAVLGSFLAALAVVGTINDYGGNHDDILDDDF